MKIPYRLVFACVLGAASAAASAAARDDELLSARELDQVYTLDEAARFLRSPSEELVRMAKSGEVPARIIAGQWRFSRIALVYWLNNDRPLRIRAEAREPMQVADAGELARITGRGTAGEAPAASAQAPKVIGEQPTARSAEDVALRDQGVLLKGGRATVEFGLNYARSELPPLGARFESNQATASVTGRYGLRDNLQFSATVPYRYLRTAQFDGNGTTSTSDATGGDATLALFGVAAAEGRGRAALIWNLQAVAPTGPGDAAVGGGLSLTKSYDPLVLYGGLSYLYGLRDDLTDSNRQLARHNFNFNLGYAYALNETIALSTQFIGSYRTYPSALALIRPRERYQLQFGLTYLLTPSLYVEPTIAFGLSSGAPDFTLGLAIPYSF